MAATSRTYTRRFFMVYFVMSSDAEKAIVRESGEKLSALSAISSFFVSRSMPLPCVSSRNTSA
ncbi:MAG: hypothetical protein EBV77_01425 [Gemmatimonadaceae bacterium]|nr:hypothetical protein [Gemmatimonadaceae bacterium]